MSKRANTKKTGREFKVILVGEGSVGKTSLIHRFCDESFNQAYLATIGVDITSKVVEIKNQVFTFVFWDIAGQEKFKTQRSVFFKGSNGVIMVCDCTNHDSLQALINWHKEVTSIVNSNLPTVLLVNKIDLNKNRKIFPDEIERVRNTLNLPADIIFETSALEGSNVDKAFFRLGELLVEKYFTK